MYSRKEKTLRTQLKRLETRSKNLRLSIDSLKGIATDLYQDLDTATSLGLEIALRYNDLKTVVTHEIDPCAFEDVDIFRRSYQAVSFLKKMSFKVDGCDPDTTARDAFLTSERTCAETNINLRKYREHPTLLDARVHTVLHYMTRDIAAILGGFDPVTWMLSCRFGPGAALGALGSSAYDKIGAKPCVTEAFAHLGVALVNTSPAWVAAIRRESSCFSDDSVVPEPITIADVDVVPGGKYTQVPKSAKTNRNIEIQPNLNAYAQMGLGAMIRNKLKIAGLDLNTQQDRNRSAAYRGSKYGHLATIDLSAASDTISYELVNELIPSRWFYAMDVCRTSHISKFDKSGVLELHRFSSMGNGYTFELESLIFWALVRACRRILNCNDEYHVFGDDIICSVKVANLLYEVIPFLGFSVNSKKSFSTSYFRESCGHDYFKGTNVRPYFFKKGENNSDLQAIISLANGLRRSAYRSNSSFGCCYRFKHAWIHCLRGIPRDIRQLLSGPWSDEDRWIICEEDVWLQNPGLFRDRFTWSWKLPSLEKRSSDKTITSYHASKAAMLYTLERSGLTFQGDTLAFSVSRAPRESSLFCVPLEHSERLRLDVTYVEMNPGLHLWV